MSIFVEELKSSYLNWVSKVLTFEELDAGVIEITSPFVDKNNDFLQIYVVKQRDGRLKITDDGFIISELSMIGVELNKSQKRKNIFQTILNGFGVSYSKDNDELYVLADMKEFPFKKHMLLQAMMSINDMFMIAKANITSLFFEDVRNFLDDHDVRYLDNIPFIGKSGYTQKFHFGIPKSKKYNSERIVHTVNNPTKEKISYLLFTWDDVRQNRPQNSELFVFMNDSEKKIDSQIITAIEEYNVTPVPWKNKEQVISKLAV